MAEIADIASGETVPLGKYQTLSRQYEILRNEYTACLIQLGKARVKLKDSRRIIKGWQDYVDRHPKYVQSAVPADRLSTPSGSRTVESGEPNDPLPNVPVPAVIAPDMIAANEQTDADNELPTVSSAKETGSTRSEARHPADPFERILGSSRSSSKSHRNPSSQTTEGEEDPTDDRAMEIRHDNDDEPVVVSARTLRRGRASPDFKRRALDNQRGQGTPSMPFKIKSERASSPIEGCPPPFPLLRTETSDLDVMVGDVDTPRKRRKLETLGHEALQRYQETGFIFNPQVNGLNDTALQAVENDTFNRTRHVSELDEDGPGTNRTFGRTIPWEGRIRDVNIARSEREMRRHSSGPLQPISTNTPNIPRTSTNNEKTRTRQRRSAEQDAKALRLIGEDIALSQEPRKSPRSRGAKLTNLLEGKTSPEPRAVISPRAPVTARRVRQSVEPEVEPSTVIRDPITARRVRQDRAEIVSTPTTGKQAKTRQRRRQPASPGPSAVEADTTHPDHEPLRARPLHRVSLADFKINPFFAGSEHAYVDPIRGREQRRCMPGCTRSCCTSLLAFAATSQAADNPNDPLNTTTALDSDDEEDTDRLLRNYLGPTYHSSITTLTHAERKDLVRKAKAQKFADRFGKHRQVFERRASPPGFWRTEMPTTQEEEDDRERARQEEREEVERRWRSALNGGGRWKFRDE